MAVGKGKFLLYSKIEPPLSAGMYQFTADQVLEPDGTPNAEIKVETLKTHVRVRSPLYVLPPDQVLSTFPPAGREGAFGSRLPQIVIKRRTLPWERDVDPVNAAAVDPAARLSDVPWLALVLIAEGEAELKSNQPVAQCVTPGVVMPGPADSQTGNCLQIRKSAIDRIFPTQQEVHLLAHARQVDVTDTELMMGDDDGFLSVVISNRLPLPGRGEAGEDVPVKYLACLVNLCGQFNTLLPKALEPPADVLVTLMPQVMYAANVALSKKDHLKMETLPATAYDAIPKASIEGTTINRAVVNPGGKAAYEAQSGWGGDDRIRGTSDLYVEMARDFGSDYLDLDTELLAVAIDPVHRFPVLIHWSFTSFGDESFESLMSGLDSGLLGTRGSPNPAKPKENPAAPMGRLPLEVVETGHVGLPHRLRRGDEVRSWYRGPLLPHPADEGPPRLPLAHAADQVRIVVPDGREDVSLAAAFEIGRLLGLSRPSMISSLMRWRQLGFQQARLSGIIDCGILKGVDFYKDVDRFIGGRLGAELVLQMLASPEEIVGNPSPLVTAGVPVLQDVSPNVVLTHGFGLPKDAFEGDPLVVLQNLRTHKPRVPAPGRFENEGLTKEALVSALDSQFSRTAVAALAPTLTADVFAGGGISGIPLDLRLSLGGTERFQPHGKNADALDDLIEEQGRRARSDDEGEGDDR